MAQGLSESVITGGGGGGGGRGGDQEMTLTEDGQGAAGLTRACPDERGEERRDRHTEGQRRDGGKDGGMGETHTHTQSDGERGTKIQREREQIADGFEHPDEHHKQGA